MIVFQVSTKNIHETESLDVLLEKNGREKISQKVEDERYQVKFLDEGVEVVDTVEDSYAQRYDSINQLFQELDDYELHSGRYGMFETGDGVKVLYDARAGDNLIEAEPEAVVDLGDMR